MLKQYGKMAESKVVGAVEEMNKTAGLCLILKNMAEDNAQLTKKADSEGSEDGSHIT